jgi:hypothetical protein
LRQLTFVSDCLLEEGLGCRDISCSAEPEIDSLPSFGYRPIEIIATKPFPDGSARQEQRGGFGKANRFRLASVARKT